jgi:hypothetical protein
MRAKYGRALMSLMIGALAAPIVGCKSDFWGGVRVHCDDQTGGYITLRDQSGNTSTSDSRRQEDCDGSCWEDDTHSACNCSEGCSCHEAARTMK